MSQESVRAAENADGHVEKGTDGREAWFAGWNCAFEVAGGLLGREEKEK